MSVHVGEGCLGCAQVGLYYLGACIGPVCGGIVMDRKGPGFTICGANIIVLLGTILQAAAPNYGTLAFARIIIGFGGLITPFCTYSFVGWNILDGTSTYCVAALWDRYRADSQLHSRKVFLPLVFGLILLCDNYNHWVIFPVHRLRMCVAPQEYVL